MGRNAHTKKVIRYKSFLSLALLCLLPIEGLADRTRYADSNDMVIAQYPLLDIQRDLSDIQSQYREQRDQISQLREQIERQWSALRTVYRDHQGQAQRIKVLESELERQSAFLEIAQSTDKHLSQIARTLEKDGYDYAGLLTSVMLLLLAVIAWCITRRITWFTEAMEAHSEKLLRLEASKHRNVRVIWWDPTRAGPCKNEWPPEAEHGEDAKVKQIYVGLPRHLRKNPETCWCALKKIFSDTVRCFQSFIRFSQGPIRAAKTAGEDNPVPGHSG